MCNNMMVPRQRRAPRDEHQPFGLMLHKARITSKRSAQAVADACGLSQTFISAIERGTRCPELDRVPAIARAYELEPCSVCWQWVFQFAPLAANYLANPTNQTVMNSLPGMFREIYENNPEALYHLLKTGKLPPHYAKSKIDSS